MEFKPIEYVPEYWEGKQNILVRCWIYLSTGLDFFNQGRYLILGVLGLYAVLKFTNPFLMVLMFAISLPILTILGHWKFYKVNKTQEYVNVKKATVTGYNGYNMTVEQTRLLGEILKELKSKA